MICDEVEDYRREAKKANDTDTAKRSKETRRQQSARTSGKRTNSLTSTRKIHTER